ncbi:hypothetical protein LV478_15730 [Komagataeibacter oboediens]|uniref:hypothetical protein n=1 Tax=Komagataeibacter oboediens TaxID=65958 RepID=UPI0023DA22D4|nr:hypothetical protein [Komagataeibacter oboediens]WEQ51932.1 hypothetical protein LV478_15730 [Komagataeibacter oboediens]
MAKPDKPVVDEEERREQISKLIWIGITVVGTLIMGVFMLRTELHALISENEPLPPGASAPATPGAAPKAPSAQGQNPANP